MNAGVLTTEHVLVLRAAARAILATYRALPESLRADLMTAASHAALGEAEAVLGRMLDAEMAHAGVN